MTVKRQTAAQTLEEVATWRPALEPVLQSFVPVFTAQEELAQALAGHPAMTGYALPPMTDERAEQGLSLLAGASFTGLAECLRQCAVRLAPLLAALETVSPCQKALATFANAGKAGDKRLETLMAAIASDDRAAVRRLAEAAKLPPEVLGFVGGFVVAPVLRALVRRMQPDILTAEDAAPWNRDGGAWKHGYCPVCGALPSLGWLEKPGVDAKNPFLVAGGGKKHLHCGVCGADWKYRRGACPSCGAEGSKVLEILRETGVNHGERLEWCTSCKGYCPCVDLREREFVPDFDALPLGLMHLDMVAARKKLRPLRVTFWNMSGDATARE